MTVTYFLLIDGVDGGSQDANHRGWFEISGYDLDLQHLLSQAGGSGGGVGKTEFSPLQVQLALSNGLTDVLARIAGGDTLRGVKIEGVTSGERPMTVFELTLGDVHITQVTEDGRTGDGELDQLAFSYDRIWVETTQQSPTGTPGTTSSFGFDLATNTEIDTSTQPVLQPGNTPGDTGEPAKYFLLIDGVDGGSQDANHRGWFEISGYDLDLQHLLSHAGGGGVGKTEFSPLQVQLALSNGLTDVLARIAGGDTLRGVKIEGVTSGERPMTVFELTLGDVHVTQVAEDGRTGDGELDQLAFSYDRIWVETTGQSPDGSIGPTSSFGFDLATNTEIDTSTQPVLQPGNTPGDTGEPAKYFLLIDGVDGGSQDANHRGWFEISGYDLDLQHLLPQAGGTGGGSGKTEFSPLQVELALSNGLTDVLARIAGGDTLRGVKIEGVTAGERPMTVFELTLGDVHVTQVAEDGRTGDGELDQLAFSYDRIWVETTGQSPDGSIGTTSSFGFDLATNTEIDTSTQPVLQPGNTPGDTGEPAKYFLLIDGVDGGSQDANHRGWFEISGYDLDLQHLLPQAGGSGGGAGKTEFSPLQVQLALSNGLTDVLARIAGGDTLRGVKIEGVTSGERPMTVFELTLGDVHVTQVAADGRTGDGELDQLAFSYDRIWVETTGQNPDGSIGPTSSFGFDLATNTEIDTSTQPVLQPGNTPGDTGEPAKYFLLIDGVDGGSQDANHHGWFEISGYDLDLQHLLPHAGGGGVGKTEFSPLQVELALSNGLTDVLARIAGGDTLRGVKIEGVTSGERPMTVFELTLGDVHITQVAEDGRTGDGELDQLAFSYDRIWVETTGQNPDGTLGHTSSFGFDLATNTEIDTSTQPVLQPGNTPGDTGEPAKYFLLIDGVDGGSQDANHRGWFEISGYDLDLQHLLPHAGGGGVGKTEFSPLLVELALSNGLTDVLARIAGGDTLRGVKIEGVTSGERPMTVFELTLGDVHVTQVTDNGETDQLAFDYRRIWVETRGQSPDGSIGPTSSFGFDLATNTEIDTSSKPELNPASLYLDGTPGDDEIVGGPGHDTIDAKEGDDRVQAGGGNDVVLGGIGDDRLNGGDGDDALDGGGDDDVLEGGDGDDLLDGGNGDDRVFGDGGDDIIIGGNGNDGLNGGAGNDRFAVTNPLTDGADKYNGGAGSDTLDFSASTQSIVLTLADGTTTFRSDTINNVENIFGSSLADKLFGNSLANELRGNDGNDRLEGNGGDDRLFGGLGIDVMRGGEGNDLVEGAEGADKIEGGNGNDVLDGGVDDDAINGGSGNDLIDGGAGNDTLTAAAATTRLSAARATIGSAATRATTISTPAAATTCSRAATATT